MPRKEQPASQYLISFTASVAKNKVVVSEGGVGSIAELVQGALMNRGCGFVYDEQWQRHQLNGDCGCQARHP